MSELTAPSASSDLGIRVASALVMLGVALVALWLGGVAFGLLCAGVAAWVLWEWSDIVLRFARGALSKAGWLLGGLIYIGSAAFCLFSVRNGPLGLSGALGIMAMVWATDVGAYVAGRAIGGPKIAPSISPSKTWAGLAGGMIAAALLIGLTGHLTPFHWFDGVVAAVVAQAGDFFESWMKRRAGVKDSGRMIPGHGGLFDRIDGLLPVAILFAIVATAA